MWRRTVDCLGIAVGIESRLPALDALLPAVLRSYTDAPGPAVIEYVLDHVAWPRVKLTVVQSTIKQRELQSEPDEDHPGEPAGTAAGHVSRKAALSGA